MLEVRFLGEQRVAVDGRNITATIPARALSLMAAFVLRPGEEQLRSRLASSFWPDSTDEQALTNLRRELHALRQKVPEFSELISSSGRMLCWSDGGHVQADVSAFIAAATSATDALTEKDLPAFAREAVAATETYAGELLPAWTDEWIIEERARLHRTCVRLLDELLQHQSAVADGQRLVSLAARRVELEPLEESGYQALMSLQAEMGDRAAALTTFHTCASTLDRELGVPPDPTTVKLYESLLSVTSQVASEPSEPRLTATGRVPLVGREGELSTLRNRWDQAQRGDGGLHLVVGEPGIGKTRLLSEFCDEVARSGGLVAQARCYSSRARLSMAPVAEWLSTKSVRVHQSALDSIWLGEVQRLVPAVGTGDPEGAPMTDSWQRHRFFEGLTAAFLASGRPTLLALDDIQWCDAETLAWLQFFLRRSSGQFVLVVASGREEEFGDNPELAELIGSLRTESLLTKTELTPLTPQLAAELAKLAGADLIDDDSVYSATGGFPLFVIESVRSDADRTAPLSAALVGSPRVQAVLDGRLDQLSDDAANVADLAAVVGQEFTPTLLQDASDRAPDHVVNGLDELWRRRIIVHHRRGTYGFSHDLLREATLRRVPPPRLASLHRRVADALDASATDDTQAGRIADHYELAGLDERALPFHERAANLAVERFAYDSAITHYQAACRLLMELAPGEERDRHELRLRHAVSAPLNARYGFASTVLEGELERALTLAEDLNDKRLELLSLVALFSTYIVQGRVPEAYDVSRRALDSSDGLPEVVGQAHFAVAGSATMLGRLAEGFEHFDLVPSLTMDQPPAVVGTRVEVHSMAWQAHALWLAGRPGEAHEHITWALDRAQSVDHPFSVAVALAYATMLAQFDEDASRVVELAEETSAVCTKHGFTYYEDWAQILAGWAQGGHLGIARIKAGLADLDVQGAYLRRPYYLSLLADLYLAEGDPAIALETLRAAQDFAVKRSDLWWLPEVLRRAAALQQPGVAEPLLHEALALAHAHGSSRLAQAAAADLASVRTD